MQDSKMPSYLLILVGVVLLALSLAADATGIGGRPGFGMRQTAGSAAGLVILIIGVYYMRKA